MYAAKHLRKASKLDPGNLDIVIEYNVELARTGKVQKAATQLRDAIDR